MFDAQRPGDFLRIDDFIAAGVPDGKRPDLGAGIDLFDRPCHHPGIQAPGRGVGGLAAPSASGSPPVGAAAVVLGWALIVLGGSVSLGGMAAVQDTRLLPIYGALAIVLAGVALALSERKATGW